MRWLRFVGLAIIAAALPSTSGASGPVMRSEQPCPQVAYIRFIGPACIRPDGLLEVFDAHGRSLGLTHGIDPRTGPEPDIAGDQVNPLCVGGAPGEYFVHVIYARTFDDLDKYAAAARSIRDVIRGITGLIDDSAARTGGHRRIRVLCAGQEITVDEAILPTPMLVASFSTIVSDLRQMGFNDSRQKYLVYYDDPGACLCAGQGNVYNDDRPDTANANNGNAGPMFAISYGSMTNRVLLHELGHTLGAVQNSAPNSTGGYHCIDGLDTMCYADSGPRGASYQSSVCPVQVFDCNNDDYFHASPPSGSYLATHWNLASPLNRYVVGFSGGAPVLTSLSCNSPEDRLTAADCSFVADDPDSAGVVYSVDWGDGGEPVRVPATGDTAPSVPVEARHTYAANGFYTVAVHVTDEVGFSGISFVEIEVGRDHDPPAITVLDPGNNLYRGCGFKVPNDTYPIFAERGCVTASIDDSMGISSVALYVNDLHVATLTEGPWIFDFAVPGTGGAVITLVAHDAGNNAGYGYAYALMF